MKANRTLRAPKPSLLAGALATCLVVATPAFAQSTAATLRGQVTTQAGAEAGATVTATNIATGASRRVQTNANGSYTLPGLPPGTYRVDAGGASQTVTVTVASTSTLNLTGTTSETPTQGDGVTDIGAVRVTAPVLREVKTSEVGNTISQRQIEQLPQATRNFLEFADVVPGMVFEIDGNGNTKLRGGASNASAGNLYIDGVGQKSYVRSGGIAGQADTQGNPFPQLAVGEYKVITSNYKAEYGQISGAAITAATRSGTNAFEGEVFYRYTDQDLREERPDEAANGKIESQTKEYGFALGGPILQDRLHFFVAYEGKETLLRVVRHEAEQFFDLVDRDDVWEAPTGAGHWQVRDVVGHLVDTTESFFVAFDAARSHSDVEPAYGLPGMAARVDERAQSLRNEPRGALVERLRGDFDKMMETFDALSEDDWTNLQVPHFYMGPLPAFFYPAFQLMDYGVHSWDVRPGTGRAHGLDGEAADLLAPFMFVLWQYTTNLVTPDDVCEIGIRSL